MTATVGEVVQGGEPEQSKEKRQALDNVSGKIKIKVTKLKHTRPGVGRRARQEKGTRGQRGVYQ
jgi:hypothetical protein